MPSPEEYLKRRSAGLCGSCGVRPPKDTGTKCEKCATVRQEWQLAWVQAITKEVFAHYGNKCACPECPETNPAFFTIDHLTAQARSRDGKLRGPHLYKQLKRLGYPDDVRLLCFNCNCARTIRGGATAECPHLATKRGNKHSIPRV